MPKILVVFSQKNKKDRKAETSSVNVKKLIEKRLEKDPEDKVYDVVTLNMKMKLKNVKTLFNASLKKLKEHEDKVAVEVYSVDPSKERGKWTIEAAKEKKSDA